MEKKVALAAGLAFFAAVTTTFASVPAAAGGAVAAHATILRQGDTIAGPLALSQPMHIVVGLKLQNKAELDAYISRPGFKPLTGAQFAARYSPTLAQAQMVVDFLKASGFTNIKVAPNRLLISADAPAGNVQHAFNTSLVRVKTHDGRMAYANTRPATVPASLQPLVSGVVGLQNVHIPHLMYRVYQSVSTNAVTGHDPADFPSVYGASTLPTAAGVSIGILAEGNLTKTLSSLNTFTSQHGYPIVTTKIVGTANGDTSGTLEWELDSQAIVGMAGGHVGSITFYMMPNLVTDSAIAEGINLAVSDDTVKIVNGSLGVSETDAHNDGVFDATDAVLEQGVAQGQTFSFSTGDDGANNCFKMQTDGACWPAASQYVVAVGGTTLNATTGSDATWINETVWSSSGGGASVFEPKPNWQTLWSGSTRAAPDISLDADPSSGANVMDGDQTVPVGGTSLAAPLFSGAWARIIAAKGTEVGFAGPLIYQAPANAFHDITVGNNGGKDAHDGYDLASGRGSVILDQLVNAVHGGYVRNDVDGDGKSDLLWRDPRSASSRFDYWIMNGSTLVSSAAFPVPTNFQEIAQGDFYGNGRTDIVWTDGSNLYMWINNGDGSFTNTLMRVYPAGGWTLIGAADIDGDGKADLLWLSGSNRLATWIMNGTTLVSSYSQYQAAGWQFLGAGDFNADGKADLLWTDGTNMQLWVSNGTGSYSTVATHTYPYGWTFAGIGDINADGYADILWRDTRPSSPRFDYWIMHGASLVRAWATSQDTQWRVASVGDYNGDGYLDIVWTDGNTIVLWPGNGTTFGSQIVHSYPIGWNAIF